MTIKKQATTKDIENLLNEDYFGQALRLVATMQLIKLTRLLL